MFLKLIFVFVVVSMVVACSDTASERDIFAAPDGGLVGGGGGSSSPSNPNGNNGTGSADCIAEYGFLNCLEGEHFRLGFEEARVVDGGEGIDETTRGFYACGASPTSEEPIDDRVVLARSGACVAYRGLVREPFVPTSLDAGPIDLFANDQVAALTRQDGCYQPQNPVNPLFFEAERVTIDVSGGDDISGYAGDSSWLSSPDVGPVTVRSDRAFDITWSSLDTEAQVVAVLDTVDTEGVSTRVRCSGVDAGDGSFEVPRSVAEELPEELVEITLTVSRTRLEEVDDSEPRFYIVRTASTATEL